MNFALLSPHVNAAVSEVGEKESALSQKDQERS